MSIPKPKWHQFSLKAMLSVFAMSAVCLTVVRTRPGRYLPTVRALEQAGAELLFTAPSMVRERVAALKVSGGNSSKILELAKELPELSTLDLRGSNVSDDDLRVLQSYPALESVDIQSTMITESGLSFLRDVRTLKKLRVGNNPLLSMRDIDDFKAALPDWRVTGDGVPLTEVQRAVLRGIVERGGTPYYDADGYVRSVEGWPLTLDRLKELAKLPRIHSLQIDPADLDGTGITAVVTDDWLEIVGRFRDAQFVSVHGPKVTDNGLSFLANLRKLYFLEIGADAATGVDVAPWQAMPKLERLSIEGSNLTSIRFIPSSSLGRLRALRIKSSQLQSLGPIAQADLPEVLELELACPQLKGDAFSTFIYPTKLTRLSFLSMSLNALTFAQIGNVESLQWMTLKDCVVSDDGWKALSKLQGFVTLYLDGTPPPADSNSAIALEAFISVHVENATVTNDHLAALAGMPALSTLHFSRCDLSGTDGMKLARCKALKSLDIYQANVADDWASGLREQLPDCEISVD